MSIKIGKLTLKNPIIAASGTYAFGAEYSMLNNLSVLGGISCKGLTAEKRAGNPGVRIAETPAGMLNSVGLENPGVEEFISVWLPLMKGFGTAVIANIAGSTEEDYAYIAERLNDEDVDGLEVNISCPNVKCGGAAFGSSPEGVERVVSLVRKATSKPIIIKLTPNTSSISECARAAETAGADAVSLINTILGMRIDVRTRRPVLHNNYGGLSGPAVLPVAVRMVNETYRAVDIPVIGMGGISSLDDVLEFMLAGATAVMVGTANFIRPQICTDLAKNMEIYIKDHNIDYSDLVGKVQLY